MSGADSDELPPLDGFDYSPAVGGSAASSASPMLSQSPPAAVVAYPIAQHPPSSLVTSTSSGSISSNSSSFPLASPKTHSSRPYPVRLVESFVKARTEAGAKTINGRLIMHRLGEGATAEVSLCQDPISGEYYVRRALKQMSKRTLLKQKEFGLGPMGRPKLTTGLDKVRREISIMSALWHPNILVLQEVIDDPKEDPLILVLEYAAKGQIMAFDMKTMKYKRSVFDVAGESPTPTHAATAAASSAAHPSFSSSSAAASSATKHHDAPIPEAIIRKLLSGVLDGVEYLHSLRIAHRDIKPENLLLGHDGSVKVSDFGVARQFAEGESTRISETQGTYHFFAPEMTTGDRYDAFKQDIWAIGLTFYILATGGLVPFMSETDNPQELFNTIGAHQTGSLPFPDELKHISPDLKHLLNHICDANPDTRLTIPQIRQHRFMTAVEPASPLIHDLRNLSITSPILVPTTASPPVQSQTTAASATSATMNK